jgi:hypothetical protein
MTNELEFIGPGKIEQWKTAAQTLSDKVYRDAVEDTGQENDNRVPNYWEGPEDVSRALAETPNDSDKNIFTPDLTLAHSGPVELPSLRMHILAYFSTEALEETTGWHLDIGKKLLRMGGIRGTAVPSRSKRGITSILMKSTQNVKVHEIKDVVATPDAGFDPEKKGSAWDKISGALGLNEQPKPGQQG